MSTERNTIRHVKKKDRAKPAEKYSTESVNSCAESLTDYATMRREELERRFVRLRRAYLSVEKFMREEMNFDLKSE